MSFDDRALGELIEESQDIQADAMRATAEPLRDLADLGRERAGQQVDLDEAADFATNRRTVLRDSLRTGGALAAGTFGIGAAMLRVLESPALAQQSPDVQILQTAASLENLAVATYQAALGLPFIQSAPSTPAGLGLVKAFAEMTMKQHAEHGKAFNDAVKKLGGKEQTAPNPVLLEVVNKAKPGLTGPGPVVDLALELEQTATEDYVAGIPNLTDLNGRAVMASIVGVESQHAAILRAVKALLAANATTLLTLSPPVDASKLPDAAGAVGFPEGFMGTAKARSNSEGAVK